MPPKGDSNTTSKPASLRAQYGVVNSPARRPVVLPVLPSCNPAAKRAFLTTRWAAWCWRAAACGLVQTYSWMANSHSDELIKVLKPFAGCTRPFFLLHPQNQHLAAMVRMLVDFLNTT